MTTNAPAPALSGARPRPTGHRPTPLTRLVAVELRKAVDTRTSRWLLALIAVGTAAAAVLYAVFAPETARTFTGYAQVALTPQGILLPVLGILLVTSEWGQRTGLVTFTLEPRRGLVVVAKVLAAAALGLAALVLVVLVAVAATAIHGSLTGDPWNPTLQLSGHWVLTQLLAILLGVGFGLLLMNSAAAIVTYFALPTVLTMVFTLVQSLRGAAPWIDLATAQRPLVGIESLSAEQWAQLGTATLLWIGLPLALGFIRLQRAEVKTA